MVVSGTLLCFRAPSVRPTAIGGPRLPDGSEGRGTRGGPPPVGASEVRVGSLTTTTDRVSSDVPGPRTTPPPPRRARGRRAAAWLVPLVIVVWLGAAAGLLWSAYTSLRAVEDAMPAARAALAEEDLEAGRAAVERLRTEAHTAVAALTHPLVAPLRTIPVLGQDLRAATALAGATADLGEAAGQLVHTLDKLPDGLSSLAPTGGRLPVETIEELAGPLRLASVRAAGAAAELQATPPSGRLAPIVSAHDRALEQVEPLAAQGERAARLATELPWLLGAGGPRTYLFAASTPAALGGTGGFLGSVSLLTVDDGRLEFGDFEATNTLENLPPGTLPAPVPEDAARWSRYGGTGAWLTLNRSPHFPAAATAMVQLWEATRGDRLDGMIVADPFALEALLELAGPQQVPDLGEVDADDVVAYVTNEAYDDFDDPNEERKEVLGAVAAAAFGGFLDGATGAELDVTQRLGELVAGGHLLVHARDEDAQGALAAAGAAGELGDGSSDLLSVVLNSGTASKVDFYAERTVEHKVSLRGDGSAISELELTLRNEAPTSGVPSYVIGPNNPRLEAGDNLVNVSVYAGRGATFTQRPPGDPELPAFTETELGYAVTDGWVRLASGEEVTRRYGWTTPDAWSVTDAGEIAYDLLFQGQTTIRPTTVDLRVHVPDGLEPSAVPEGATYDGGAILWSGELRGEDVLLEVRLRPSGR